MLDIEINNETLAAPMFVAKASEFYREGAKAQRSAKEMKLKCRFDAGIVVHCITKTFATLASLRLCGEYSEATILSELAPLRGPNSLRQGSTL